MNKDQYITALQEMLKEDGLDLSKSNLTLIIKASHELITKKVTEGESIQFIGFGTYKALHKKETKGRNPQTGAEMTIPAKIHPKFAPGSQFKDAVNGKTKAPDKKKTKAPATKPKAADSTSKKKK